MKSKFSLRHLLDNNQVVLILSVLAAITLWALYAFWLKPEITRTILVPVNTVPATEAVGSLGLQVAEVQANEVWVTITGNRLEVTAVEAKDIEVVLDVSPVTGPQKYTLKVNAKNVSDKAFFIQSCKPDTIDVQFSPTATTSLAVEMDFAGLSSPDGYKIETTSISPSQITISGPESEIARVARCAVIANFDVPLTTTQSLTQDILLLDKDGQVVNSMYITKSADTAAVIIPVKKIMTLPVSISFINVPPEFPLDDLYYTFSADEIEVAAPEEIISKYSEIPLGFIDFKTFDPAETYVFNLESVLPAALTNIGDVQTVQVSFNSDEFTSVELNVGTFQIINKPVDYNVSLATTQLRGVRIIGPADDIKDLAAGDVVVQVDISERQDLQPGRFQMPVKVFVPNKGLMWAYGNYTVDVVVRER